jgi:predicted ABC-type ATPase
LTYSKYGEGVVMISNTQSTRSLYADQNGVYNELRKKLHRQIIRKILRSKKPQDDPEIMFMGGGTACGKSTIRDIYLEKIYPPVQFAVIDCDAIKFDIPEYESFKKLDMQTASDRVHTESGDIAMMALYRALEMNINIVFDATMKDKEWYDELIERVKEAGYRTFAIIVYAPLEVALEREAERALITQRVVPREEIEKSHYMVSNSFHKLMSRFDSFALWDNSGHFEDIDIIAERVYGSEEVEVYDEDLWKVFFAKGGITL